VAKVCQGCGEKLELLKDVFAKSIHKLGGETRELLLCVHCAARMNDAEKLEKAFDDQAPRNSNDKP
jgi:hypothetical protein